MNEKSSFAGTIGAIWGIVGWVVIPGYAVYKLSKPVTELIFTDLAWYHWVAMVLFGTILFYFKAYRGFQRIIAPRIAVRARYLRTHPRPIWLLLAPLFCMGFFHIIRRKQIITILMTVAMVTLIFLVRLLPSPWRGIVDVSILLALGWGALSIIWYGVVGLTTVSFPHPTYINE